MPQPISRLRPKRAQLVTISVALFCALVSGCTDQQATGPELPGVRMTNDVAFNKFFIAWAEEYAASPLQLQLFTLDPRQDRQFADFADERVLAFARANPGRLYINGDEPDQYCAAPDDYAVWYHDFVQGVRSADPTARFSPAGFAEPNYKCCPLPDDVPQPCWSLKHSVLYANDFYNAYVQRYGVAPPVDEWRFHDFGIAFGIGDLEGWWYRVDKAAQWSIEHGAKMVLGSWGFMGWREPASDYQEHMKLAMSRLMNDPRIIGAVYWSHKQWLGNPHYLANGDGSFTPEGQTYLNPLTDVPVGVAMGDSVNAQAQLKWTNTTNAWAAEAEFWVQAPGSSSFVFGKSQLVEGPGATATPLVPFNGGERVKARVRYYNPYGQGAWSAFSNVVLIESPPASQNYPLPCFSSKRIASQGCD